MGRIRTIKPEFFFHDELFELEEETGLPIRIAFIGLWTQCDREGRFDWNPRKLKAQILPYDEIVFSRVLDALATRGFLVSYASTTGDFRGKKYGFIPSFTAHQVVNGKESESKRPEPPEPCNNQDSNAKATREPREEHACRREGKGKEGKGTLSPKPKNHGNTPIPIKEMERVKSNLRKLFSLKHFTRKQLEAIDLELGTLCELSESDWLALDSLYRKPKDDRKIWCPDGLVGFLGHYTQLLGDLEKGSNKSKPKPKPNIPAKPSQFLPAFRALYEREPGQMDEWEKMTDHRRNQIIQFISDQKL